jgi:hypothetical protein
MSYKSLLIYLLCTIVLFVIIWFSIRHVETFQNPYYKLLYFYKNSINNVFWNRLKNSITNSIIIKRACLNSPASECYSTVNRLNINLQNYEHALVMIYGDSSGNETLLGNVYRIPNALISTVDATTEAISFISNYVSVTPEPIVITPATADLSIYYFHMFGLNTVFFEQLRSKFPSIIFEAYASDSTQKTSLNLNLDNYRDVLVLANNTDVIQTYNIGLDKIDLSVALTAAENFIRQNVSGAYIVSSSPIPVQQSFLDYIPYVPPTSTATVPAPAPASVPVTVPAPAPASVPVTVPAPAAVPATVPAAVPAPAPAAVPATVPATVPAPAPATDYATDYATVPAPVPAPVPATVPATVPASVPAAVPATVPATVYASVPATVPAPVPAAVPATVPATVPAAVPAAVPASIEYTHSVLPKNISKQAMKFRMASALYNNEELLESNTITLIHIFDAIKRIISKS